MPKDKPDAPPKLRHGALIPADALAALAKASGEACGKSQTELGKELGKSQTAVWSAMNQPERSYTELRAQIVEHCTDYTLEGPFYRVVRKGRK